MKRIIALFLVCILAVPILAVPASAAEHPYFELLDYGYWILDGSESSTFSLSGGSIGRFDFEQTMQKVQIVYNGSSEIYVNGQVYTGTSMGGSLYYVEQTGLFNELVLQCANGIIDLCSVRAIPSNFQYIPVKFDAFYNGVAGNKSESGVYTFDAMLIPELQSDGGAFSLSIQPDDYTGLEYIDINISFIRWEVASLAVTQGEHGIDCEILSHNNFGDYNNTYIIRINANEAISDGENIVLKMTGGAGSLFGVNVHGVYGLPPVSEPNGVVSIIVRLIDTIRVNFSVLTNNIAEFISAQTSAISGFFTNLTSNLSGWFNQLINGPDYADDSSDALGSMVEEQLGQYEENEQIIATAPTINPDDYDVIFDFGAEISDGFTSDYTGILSRILEIEYIGYLIVMPIIFGFVGYVLHGKVF